MEPKSGNENLVNKILLNNKYFAIIFLLFFGILISYLMLWPIVMTDTDLWYHLAGGRYFWQNWKIVHDAFFSYIQPDKEWYNYYWLFQVLIYKIFQWSEYYGLVFLRAVLYASTALFIFLFLVRQNLNRTNLLFGAFVFVACTFSIIGRELTVRPHLFSYFFIVAFIYIIEFRQKYIWLLPIFGVLWSNIHGIEYPVMYLIVFAYLIEIYWRAYRKTSIGETTGKKEKWLLILVFYTIFITPGVIELVQTPFSVSFQTSAYQHLYVAELLPIPWKSLFAFSPVTVQDTILSLRNVIFILVGLSLFVCVMKRKLRISHVILLIGASALLIKHNRFSYEFTLLSIPLLHHGIGLMTQKDWLPRKIFIPAFPVISLIVPFLILHYAIGNRPTYPFSRSGLPTSVTRFLNQKNPEGGNILNEANTGGYLQWALKPEYKIYMDMQMTIFNDLDFTYVSNALYNSNSFKAFVSQYDPIFISVNINRYQFTKVIKNYSEFVPIYFDEAEVLYVNRSHKKDIADQYALKAINPFSYHEVIYADISNEKLQDIYNEAIRIHNFDPGNYRANHILSSIYVVRKQYDKAIAHAEAIIRIYPEQSHGYALKADALFAMKRYEEAALLYFKALNMGRTSKAQNVYWNLHASYFNMKEYKKAYRVLSKYVNPFDPNTDARETYQLAASAASVGKAREAVVFLKIARLKVSPDDLDLKKKIDDYLVRLDTEKK